MVIGSSFHLCGLFLNLLSGRSPVVSQDLFGSSGFKHRQETLFSLNKNSGYLFTELKTGTKMTIVRYES